MKLQNNFTVSFNSFWLKSSSATSKAYIRPPYTIFSFQRLGRKEVNMYKSKSVMPSGECFSVQVFKIMSIEKRTLFYENKSLSVLLHIYIFHINSLAAGRGGAHIFQTQNKIVETIVSRSETELTGKISQL